MILELHLCGPKGDGQRLELDAALALLQMDNEFLVSAMLGSGRPVPDTVGELGLAYRPPTAAEARTPRQRFMGLAAMMNAGCFSCQEAAGWEAAVLTVKHRIPARAYHLPVSDDGLFHAIYQASGQIIDPVAVFLAQQGQNDFVWEAVGS